MIGELMLQYVMYLAVPTMFNVPTNHLYYFLLASHRSYFLSSFIFPDDGSGLDPVTNSSLLLKNITDTD